MWIAQRLDYARLALLLVAALVVIGLQAAPAAAQSAPACPSVATTFSASPVTGSVTDADVRECFALQDVSAGDRVAIRAMVTGGQIPLSWTIVDNNDNAICTTGWLSEDSACALSGTPGWRLVVTEQWDGNWSGTTTFSATVRRTNTSEGCTSLDAPASFSFGAERTNSAIQSVMGIQCFAFSRDAGAADEALWIRTDRTSGTIQPRWRLYGPSGSVECAESGTEYHRCELRASGPHRLLVDDAASGTGTGSFFVAATRTSGRAGCSAISSTAFDAPATTGRIAAAGDAACHTLQNVASGDRLRIGLDAPTARWAVIDGSGNAVCGSSWQRWESCTLTGSSDWALIVYSAHSGASFDYSIAVRKLNDPAGCSALGPTDEWSFTRPRTNGSLANGLASRCYSFVRGDGDADETAWISTVRTTGNVAPAWHLYGPQGDEVCGSYAGANFRGCEMRAAGAHAVVVEDENAASGGSYYLRSYRTSERAGCSALPSAAFGTDPVSGAVATAGEVDCLNLAGVSAGDQVDVRVGGVYWTIADGDGRAVCSAYDRSECRLSGSPGWSLLVFESGGTATFTYTAAVRRLNDPDGCASLGAPDAWSFTSPRITGAISGPSRPRCYVFERSLDEPDGRYMFRAIRSSGTLAPVWRVYSASGQLECSDGSWWNRICELRGPGAHTVVVDDSSGVQPGTFSLVADRLSDPAGCSDIRSVTQGVPKSLGRLTSAGEVDCFVVPASTADQFAFKAEGSADRLALLAPDGSVACSGWGEFSCTTTREGPYLALVDASNGTSTGSYTFEATCTNAPCGLTDTAILDVTPSSVGAGSQASVLLRGRDLDLLDSVRFVRDGTEIVGALQPAAPDGRTRIAQLNTAGAPVGGYRLVGSFIDGSTRQIENALSVTSAKPADVELSLVGREAFRVGVSSTVTVQATNSGNVDGRGVMMVVGGFPQGSTISPVGGVTKITGTRQSPRFEVKPFDQETGSITTPEGIVAPFIIPRVPANSSVQIKFEVTVPSNTSYRLRVRGGECMDQAVPGALSLHRAATPGEDCAYGLIKLANNVGDLMLDTAGGGCISLVRDTLSDAVFAAGTSSNPITLENGIGFGLGAAGCAAEFFPPAKIVKTALDIGSFLWDGYEAAKAGYDCAQAMTESEMAQQAVASIDPNDIIGPSGSGDKRYITGEGDQLYQVLFENLPSASAPAQRVVVTNQLDASTFDPSTVRFRSVQFGDTTVPLPTPVAEIDETVDLRPANNLLVRVTSGVTAAGQIQWVLQAIDPDTLAPPEDALAGFLPPNDATHRGEGGLTYTVRLRQLAEGTEVENKASIVFDANEAIETPTWSNVIDRSPPAVGLSAAAEGDPQKATVTWTGSDVASGVTRWDITVSKDGGTPTLWHSSQTAGSAQFKAEEAGTYAFRAVAHDGANNSTQSSQSAVVLTVPAPPAQVPPGTGGPKIDPPAPPSGGEPPQPPAPVPPTPKPEPPVSVPAKRDSVACKAQRARRANLTTRIAKSKKSLRRSRGARARRLKRRLKADTKARRKVDTNIRRLC